MSAPGLKSARACGVLPASGFQPAIERCAGKADDGIGNGRWIAAVAPITITPEAPVPRGA
jgi:hypothetical protein